MLLLSQGLSIISFSDSIVYISSLLRLLSGVFVLFPSSVDGYKPFTLVYSLFPLSVLFY